jgi:pyruvate,water dikinase
MVVQGAVNPDEFYVYKPTLRQGKPAILRRSLGAKQHAHGVFDQPGERVRIEDTPADCATVLRQRRRRARTAQQALVIEQHYGRPMDIEWAKDGVTGKLFIVQARPETVKSRGMPRRSSASRSGSAATCVAEGRAIGQKIGAASRAWCVRSTT